MYEKLMVLSALLLSITGQQQPTLIHGVNSITSKSGDDNKKTEPNANFSGFSQKIPTVSSIRFPDSGIINQATQQLPQLPPRLGTQSPDNYQPLNFPDVQTLPFSGSQLPVLTQYPFSSTPTQLESTVPNLVPYPFPYIPQQNPYLYESSTDIDSLIFSVFSPGPQVNQYTYDGVNFPA